MTPKELWEDLDDAGKSLPKASPAKKRRRKTDPAHATHEPPESCSVPVQTTPSKHGRKKRRCMPEKDQRRKQEAQDTEKDQRTQGRNHDAQDTEKDQHTQDRNQESQDTEKDQRTQDRNQKAQDTERDQRKQRRNQKAQVAEAEVTESESEEDAA